MCPIDESRMDRLIALAGERLGVAPLPSESKILRESASSSDLPDTIDSELRLPVRPEFLRWLLTDQDAANFIDPKGIRIVSATIQGQLDLSFCNIVPMLVFNRCTFQDSLLLLHSSLRGLGIYNSSIPEGIIAHGITVRGPLFLGEGFQSSGYVDFHGARIAGSVQCSGTFLPVLGAALSFESATIQGDLTLSGGFRSCGEIRLLGIEIDGDFNCNGASMNAIADGKALSLDRATIKGNVMMTNLVASGTCCLSASVIEGQINCRGARFVSFGTTLVLDGATVRGSIDLQSSRSAGTIRLVGAEAFGPLDCTNSTVTGSPNSLMLDRARIRGGVFLRKLNSAGAVRMPSAQIEPNVECQEARLTELYCHGMKLSGELKWTSIQNPKHTRLTLTSASIGRLRDDKDSWPSPDDLALEGLTYDGLSLHPAVSTELRALNNLPDALPLNADERIEWIERQRAFTRQPYRQLAKILRDAGDYKGWRKVCFRMEERTWALRREKQFDQEQRGRVTTLCRKMATVVADFVLRVTIGYGYSSIRAVYGLILVFLLGAGIYFIGFQVGSIVPTEEKNNISFTATRALLPGYERFHVLAYSLDNSFPPIKLGIQDKWGPSPDIQTAPATTANWAVRGLRPIISPGFVRWFRWLQIVLGWILTTFFLIGVTGLIRND
jgi:hypothetical protein